MYIEHPVVNTPADQAVVWRYLDFTKFVSLLDRKALFFCRADKFEDQFEGRYSIANDRNRVQRMDEEDYYLAATLGHEGFRRQTIEEIEKQAKGHSEFYEKLRRLTLINCWIQGDYENAAMWKIFGNMHDGVAIQTTCAHLKNALKDTRENVYIGSVKYVDMENEFIPEDITSRPYFHKWKYYDYEQEVRLLTEVKSDAGWDYDWSKEEVETGKYLKIDVNHLIQKVFVAPYCQNWFFELVKSSLVKYGLEKEVVKSRLGEDPKKILK